MSDPGPDPNIVPLRKSFEPTQTHPPSGFTRAEADTMLTFFTTVLAYYEELPLSVVTRDNDDGSLIFALHQNSQLLFEIRKEATGSGGEAKACYKLFGPEEYLLVEAGTFDPLREEIMRRMDMLTHLSRPENFTIFPSTENEKIMSSVANPTLYAI